MPAVSQKQQKFMGIVHGLQKGTVDPSKVSGQAKDVAQHIGKKAATDFAATKHQGLPKKVKKEGLMEDEVGSVHVVRKPYPTCSQSGMVYEVNPMEGLHPHGFGLEEVHGIYHDEKKAHKIAEGLYQEHVDKMQELEEKKADVTDKIKKAIDQLEAKRKEHIDAAKEDPSNASGHKEHIANLAHKIEDLMSKLETVEKSKKPVADDKEKKAPKTDKAPKKDEE
jgi:uncharacterized protein (UPF0335 family)